MPKILLDAKIVSQSDRDKINLKRKYVDAASCIVQASKKSIVDQIPYYVWPTDGSYQLSKEQSSVHPNYGHVEVRLDTAKFYS
jgi:hypothetical protein